MCFGCYLLFSRQPDYLDGEKAPATIQWTFDSASNRSIPKANFNTGLKNYAIDARYVFREWKNGDKTLVIYESGDPAKAAVYSIWGYWITWEELVYSIVLLLILYRVAVAITSNPTPEAVVEQLDFIPEKKRKYDE
ncbi:MAG: hypothetical protein JWQ78_411 [Sediminibacterium sp.]|nr:hypothetical protein [Sediminibacterium sp.]